MPPLAVKLTAIGARKMSESRQTIQLNLASNSLFAQVSNDHMFVTALLSCHIRSVECINICNLNID